MQTAPSVLTRVRVLRLLKIMAMVLPERVLRRDVGIEPDLMACLWECALRTRVVSSVDERSAIERRDRGAKGEVGGAVGEERWRICVRRWRYGGRKGGIESAAGLYQKFRVTSPALIISEFHSAIDGMLELCFTDDVHVKMLLIGYPALRYHTLSSGHNSSVHNPP